VHPLTATLSACAGSAQRADSQTRLATAKAMFQERCKHAGEFIHRTADNVDGILLMKLRPNTINRQNQYALDDPYGRDLGGEGYIQSFVRGFETRQAQFAPGSPNRYGYLYVDAIDPKDKIPEYKICAVKIGKVEKEVELPEYEKRGRY
jgi:hypothetical protein